MFYHVIGEVSGFEVEGTHDILRLMRDLSGAKREYDKVSSALGEVRDSGYGVVTPSLEEMFLEEPGLSAREAALEFGSEPGHRLFMLFERI